MRTHKSMSANSKKIKHYHTKTEIVSNSRSRRIPAVVEALTIDKKAPGLDDIPNKALKVAIKNNKKVFVERYYWCLKLYIFRIIIQKVAVLLAILFPMMPN